MNPPHQDSGRRRDYTPTETARRARGWLYAITFSWPLIALGYITYLIVT